MGRLRTIHFFVLFAETTVRKIWFVETLPFQDGYGKELRISSLSQTRLRAYEMPFEEYVAESVCCLKCRWILAGVWSSETIGTILAQSRQTRRIGVAVKLESALE